VNEILKSKSKSKLMDIQTCPICSRPLGKENISKHHLIPKSAGGKDSEIILIHNICHQKIHSVFMLKELRDEFNTVGKLVEHEEIAKFIKWVSKKAPQFYQKNARMKRKELF
jgi:5-methylcytosine-specific restriction endonuclease McrA